VVVNSTNHNGWNFTLPSVLKTMQLLGTLARRMPQQTLTFRMEGRFVVVMNIQLL
jgi:hypothetical protein